MSDQPHRVLKRQRPWREAYYYQKTEVLFQMTYVFCQRFMPAYGNRTVDQMVQAARSGKQNIIEGTEAGETSTETHIKLLNVARASLQELREDYRDYLISRNKEIWTEMNDRFAPMRDYCRQHNQLEDYQPYFEKWDDEVMANVALTLCYMTDAMLHHQIIKIEEDFVTNGGIKERMHAERTKYRQEEDAELKALRAKVPLLEKEIARLRKILKEHGIDY